MCHDYSYNLMTMKSLFKLLSCCLILFNYPTSFAEQTPQSVTIKSMRDPVDKSYRKMLDGMALFEKKKHMAPNASLRYKLLPRQYDTQMQGIVLKIVGDSFTTLVPIREDGTFTLNQDKKAHDEDASVRPNRKAGSMTWRVEIKTPNLPDNVRRLGDLRLECEVGVEAGLISRSSTFGNLIRKMVDLCDNKKNRTGYYFFADKPIFKVTLNDQGRKKILPINYLYASISLNISKPDLSTQDCQVLIDKTYFLPLGDTSWPDDTLVEFEYMDDAPTSSTAINLKQD